MKTLLYCGAAALISLSVPALADDKTLDPVELTVQAKRPPLTLDEQQRVVLQNALATQDTEQKTPPNFQPKVGDPLPMKMTVDVMPPDLVAKNPSLAPFGYAKTAKDILVIDPLKKTIIAVLPRRQPSMAKDPTAPEWAATKGRALIGKTPEPAGATTGTSDKVAHEPAGDSGDKTNGNEKTGEPKK